MVKNRSGKIPPLTESTCMFGIKNKCFFFNKKKQKKINFRKHLHSRLVFFLTFFKNNTEINER
jgi:hypothetical protein